MKIFVYEYICGGALAGRQLPDSLAREGWAMLASIVEDFAGIQGCEVLTALDERFAGRPLAARHIRRITAAVRGTSGASDCDEWERRTIAELAGDADWSLIIAPETAGVLLDRVRWVEQAGGRLIGPSSAAVALAADKLQCARVLRAAGVPVVQGDRVDLGSFMHRGEQMRYPIVLKPRDGAGSQATFVIYHSTELAEAIADARKELPGSEFMVEPYVRGVAASVSFLMGSHGSVALLPAEQLLSHDGRLRYCGGRIPLEPVLARRAIALGARAVAAIPGLSGYVGVDLVLQAEIPDLKSRISDFQSEVSDSWPDTIIEINPRLTTSYVGLRRLARANLAERQLRVVAGECCEPVQWREGTIGFLPDGQVTYSLPDPGIMSSGITSC